MFHWDFDRKFRPIVIENFQIEYGDESKLLAHTDFSDNQKSEARIE